MIIKGINLGPQKWRKLPRRPNRGVIGLSGAGHGGQITPGGRATPRADSAQGETNAGCWAGAGADADTPVATTRHRLHKTFQKNPRKTQTFVCTLPPSSVCICRQRTTWKCRRAVEGCKGGWLEEMGFVWRRRLGKVDDGLRMCFRNWKEFGFRFNQKNKVNGYVVRTVCCSPASSSSRSAC